MNLWMHLLELEITTRCNLNCRHCYNRGNKNMDMLYDDVIYYINFSNKNNVSKLVISGGEACLHKDFEKICEYLNKNREKLTNIKTIVLQTNGLIGKYDLSRLKGFDLFHISFDLDDNKARIINVKKTLELADRIKNYGYKCYLFSTVHKNNVDKIDEIVKIANDSNNNIAFNLCIDTGSNSEFLLTKQEKKHAIEKLLKYAKQGKINKLKHPYANVLEGIYDIEPNNKIKGGCTAGIATCTILSNGDVVPCPFLRIVAGNIYEQKLEDIWLNSNLFRALRDRSKYSICGKCKFVNYCGGCRKSALQSSKNILGMDFNCIINGYLNIRKASVDDIDSLVKIKINSWRNTYKGIINNDFLDSMSYEDNYNKFMKEIENPDFQKKNFVITKDEVVVGYVKFEILKDSEYDSEIYAMYVDNSLKNKGYGTQLINYIKQYLKDQGCNNLILWCACRNYSSRNFYKKRGGIEGKKIKSKIGSQNIYKISYVFEL